MIRTRMPVLLGLAALAAVTASGPAAHANTTATPPVQVRIYLENDNHNPGTVTVTCGEGGPVLHTALFNDAVGADTPETAKVYREDGGAANAANWPVVLGPVNIPVGGHVNVNLPYVPGTSYNAVAVPEGDPWPATLTDLIGRLSAHPPTADNSQLLPSGYPAIAPECPTPTPTTTAPTTTPAPCATVTPVRIADAVVLPTPTCPTTDSEPSRTPTTRAATTPPTSAATTTASTPAGTLPPVSSTTLLGAPVSSDTTTALATVALAHTGSSAVPVAIAAVILLGAGGALVRHAKKKARGH